MLRGDLIMANNREKKQIPLKDKKSCIIYLYKIISSCEICMDTFKIYNLQAECELKKFKKGDLIPIEIYQDICHKTYNVMEYILNLLGDAQTSSISYFKYRNLIQKRIKKGMTDIQILPHSEEITDLLSEFNKMRNWLNHVPESLLVSEMELVNNGKAELPLNPVIIVHHKFASYEYFEHLYLSNVDFCKKARKIIQAAKRDYSLLVGESVSYQRVYSDEPIGIGSAEAAKMSAKIQGLKEE